MPNFDAIKDLVEKCKTPYLKVSDNRGNKIICIECATTRASIAELENIRPILESYGHCEVVAANADQYKANWKGAYKWMLVFDKVVAPNNNQMAGMPNMTGWNWGQPPPGFVSNDVMLAKLNEIETRMKYEKELSELRAKLGKKDEDPAEKYIGYSPMIMSAMGWPDEKIEKMMKYYMMGKGAKGMAGMPDVENTLTFKDVEKMTPEKKNETIQTLLDSIAKKVPTAELIKLFEAVEKNPALAEKAVNILGTL